MDVVFIEQFFSKSVDWTLFKSIPGAPSSDDRIRILTYVEDILSVPLSDYLSFVASHPITELVSKDNITQTSKLKYCTSEMCDAFVRAGYKALSLREIGWYLHNDFIIRPDGTESKFGENVKGASQLGLAIIYGGKWYLSPLGKVYLSLSETDRNALMARCLLRDPLYRLIFVEALERDVDLYGLIEDYVSGKTIQRRRSSIRSFCSIIVNQSASEGGLVFHSII